MQSNHEHVYPPFFGVVLTLLLWLATPGALSAEELVFILAGQSNMAGQGNTSELAPFYRRTPSNVSFYYNGYKTPLNRFAHFGPEIGFAHEIARRFPHTRIKLIKFAVGGTSLLAWDPHWSVAKARLTRNASAGPLFKKLVQTAAASKFDGSGARLAGILWMQGETDSKYPGVARQYVKNLNNFIHALRLELKKPDALFIMGEVNPPVKLFPAASIVQRAQKNAATHIRNLRLVNTQDLPKRNDQLHYNTQGQLELGKRFAKAYLSSHVASVRPP